MTSNFATFSRDTDGDTRLSLDDGTQASRSNLKIGQPGRILIIEDDDVDFMALYRILCGKKHQVHRANDLRSAMAMITSDDFSIDLVITDLFLDDAYPTTTFDEISNSIGCIPLFVVSSYPNDLAILRRRATGTVDFFDKNTINKETFHLAVDHALYADKESKGSGLTSSLHEIGSNSRRTD